MPDNPQPIQLPDSHETLESPNTTELAGHNPQQIQSPDHHETLESLKTTELAADVEMQDPLELVDQPIIAS